MDATTAEERAVACPNCQAKPGEPCTQPTVTSRRAVSWHHSARLIDAERERAARQ